MEDVILFLFSSPSLTSSSASSSCLSLASSSLFWKPEPKPKLELCCERELPRSESKNTHPPPPLARCHYSVTGIFLLQNLSVMVFCGHLYAILWMSSWLCLIPPWKFDTELVMENATMVELLKVQRKGLKEDKKKRIILEGLLEWNQRIWKKTKKSKKERKEL